MQFVIIKHCQIYYKVSINVVFQITNFPHDLDFSHLKNKKALWMTLNTKLLLHYRVFTVDRVIQMNMEIALVIAHLFLLFPYEISTDNPVSTSWRIVFYAIVSTKVEFLWVYVKVKVMIFREFITWAVYYKSLPMNSGHPLKISARF